MIPGQLPPRQYSAISLPPSLFKNFNDHESVGVLFAFYEMATLFPVGRRNTEVPGRQTQVGSQVVAATVNSSNELIGLEEPIILIFRLQLTEEQVLIPRTSETFTAAIELPHMHS